MLTVILKGTDGCNLNCLYCSLGEKVNVGVLSLDKFTNILEYICRICENKGETEFKIILHGGEPTLIPVSLYEEGFRRMKSKFPDVTAHILMQTNGYIISNEMMKFIIKHHVAVGISIDGSQEIHDAERKSKSGENTFQRVRDNIEKLIENDIEVSCLMVLTSKGIDSDYSYLRYFAERGIHLKINPLLDYGEVYKNPQLSIKPGEYAEYLIGLYEYIISENIDVQVSPLDKYLQSKILKKPIAECTYNPNCSKNFLCIDYLGDIYPCGKFSDIKRYCLGKVDGKLVDLDNNETIQQLLSRRNELKPKECMQCEFQLKCNAGCTAEAVIEGNIRNIPKSCLDYKILFEYFKKDGLVFLRNHLQFMKEKMMEKLENGL